MSRTRMRWAVATALVLVVGAAPAASPQSTPRRFTVAAAGDIIPHSMLVTAGDRYRDGPGWDFRPMTAEIEPWVASADLAICHLEGTLSADSRGLSGYPYFIGPREMAEGIRTAGWDGCSTASNHSMDGGASGVIETLAVLDDHGLAHAGTARTPDERLPTFYDVDGIRVAHLSFTYGTNGLPVPTATPWAVNLIDVATILDDAARARAEGSEFTIVSLHWGWEYVVDPTPEQRAIAAALLASPDVDVILGHHAHVVQPIEMIDGKYVVYGMGNHLTNQFLRWGPMYFGTEDGLLVRLHVSEQPDGGFAVESIEITPTWVEYGSYRVFSAADVVETGRAATSQAQASYDRTVARALRLSAPGVTVSATPWPEVSCGSVRATIVGTPGDDLLAGTDRRDVIAGRAGNDTVDGGGGGDLICGGDGDDRLDGGADRDVVLGGSGNDTLIGDRFDVLLGGDGTDRCDPRAPLRDCER